MASANLTVLIDIASASHQVLNASYDRNRNDKNVRRSHIRLEEKLLCIIATSQTLLNEALQTGHSSFTSRNSVVHSRMSAWLSSNEPQECLDSLHVMERLITSSSNSMTSPFNLNPFHVMSPKDMIKDALQVFEKHKNCFYFLLTTDVWNQSVDKVPSRSAPVKPPMAGVAFVKEGANFAERDLVNRERNAMPTKLHRTRFMIDEAQLGELLKWLAAWNCTSKHEDTLDLRQPSTCTWLMDTFEYTMWRNTDNSFLWLNGKPGSGKSVLAASVVDAIKKTLNEGELLVYFYCDFRSERSTASAEIMRSLLSQLLRGLCDLDVDPGDTLSGLVEEKRQQGAILTNAKRLSAFVSRAAKQFARQPLMVIDALDECNDIENLLDVLVLLTKSGIRLFVVSRPLQIVKDSFSGLETICLESMSEKVAGDIKLHVATEVDSHRRLRIVDPMLKEEISRTLCEKADGMFRWIECQLITLKRCPTAVDIRKALKSLPIGLEATYEQIFLTMEKADIEGVLARRALVWLVAASGRLRLCEIVEALSIDVKRRILNRDVGPVHGPALLDTLGSLVTHDKKTDIVILSHFSVKAYLVTKHSYWIDERGAHVQVARQCMSYVGACLKLDNGVSNDSYPLLEYALSSGFNHLRHVYSNNAILHAIVALDKDIRQHPWTWSLIRESCTQYGGYLPSIEHDFVLYILVRYTPEGLLRLFLGHSRPQPKEGTNPLNYVTRGKANRARILLSYGAKLDHPGRFVKSMFGSTTGLPIEAAVQDGNRELVDLFIAEGSPVPRRLFSVAIEGKDAWTSTGVVARLTQTDEFMEWATETGEKTLILRALEKCAQHDLSGGKDILDMTRRLRQIGCDFTGYNLPINNLLRHVVRAGHGLAIEYFFSELEVPLPPDVLFSLPSNGCPAQAIRCLLRNGADIHFSSPDDSTVLHHFIEQCDNEDNCLKGTKILFEAGCDPSVCNLQGKTPIHIAAQRGFTSVVRHLLSFGAPLPLDILFSLFTGGLFHTPSLKTMRFLIGEAADPNVVAPNGDTLLHLALQLGSNFHGDDCLEIIRILVAAGCDPRAPNSRGQTPIELAAAKGRLPVVKYLLPMSDAPPHNLLQPAASSFLDNFSVVNVLPAKGADAYMTSSDKHKALHHALMTGNHWDDGRCLQVAKILADSGCPQPYTCDCTGKTLFHVIVRHRCSKVLKMLLSRGVLLPCDILLAPWYQDEEDLGMIQLLLKNGADARATGSCYKDTPLHRAFDFAFTASESLKLRFAEILIGAGADPCAVDSLNKTPMHRVVKHGYLNVINYLLSLHVPLPPDILLTAAQSYSHNNITPTVRFLVDNGAVVGTVTTNGDNALHLTLAAYGYGNEADSLETTKILVDAGCDICAANTDGETPFFVATKAGHITIAEYLRSRGAPLPDDILLAAASLAEKSRGDLEAMSVIQSLISMGLNSTHIHAVTSNGDTILHRAATADSLFVKRLVDMGCNPLLHNLSGETPLDVAARHYHISVSRYFLSIGLPLSSDVLLSIVLGNSRKPQVKMSPMIRLVVREGADVNVTNSNGDTPLHVLLQTGFKFGYNLSGMDRWEAIQTLLNSGCNPHTCNHKGQTPVDLAKTKGPSFLQNFMRLVKNAQNISIPRLK